MRNALLIFLVIPWTITVSPAWMHAEDIPVLTTVDSAMGMRDDADVILEGHIIKVIRPEHFLFRDGTGEIEVEIDDEDSRGVTLTPAAKIRIIGEVDRELNSVTIDVDHVEAVK